MPRQSWIDQARGFAMFLVVYGHNYPAAERYIYSFHMPLFLVLSGFFFPDNPGTALIQKRFKTLMVPYFFWALVLFLFWLWVGKDLGASAGKDLSPAKNFMGVFYAQGDQALMDWGIPMWFLPNIFLAFVFLVVAQSLLPKFSNLAVMALVVLGLGYSHVTKTPLFWSLNVAWVSMFFIFIGKYIFKILDTCTKSQCIKMMVFCFTLHFFLYAANVKIDMYRSQFGNEWLFLLNGISGSLFIILFFKLVPVFRWMAVVGKFTIAILAFQLLAMSAIKLCLLKVFGISDFNFSEVQKFLFAILQMIIILPLGFLLNKYVPLLNGGFKKI